MNKKIIVLMLVLTLVVGIAAGCAGGTEETTTATTVDASAGASMVSDAAGFEAAVAAEGGAWIINSMTDITVDKALTLSGTYYNGKTNDDGTMAIQRKIGLYEQDEERNVTAAYTLTIPKLTVTSPNGSLVHTTLIGDLVVAVDGFKLQDATIEGNVYFTSQEVMDSFIMDEDSSVSGTQELTADVAAGASMVGDAAGFEAAVDAEGGTWIINSTMDITVDKELTLGGTYYNGKTNDDGTPAIQRKIGLYEQDEERNVTAEYTLTIPKLTVTSPNGSLVHTTLVGDLVVAVDGFKLQGAKIEGNVYFTSQEVMDSFVMDEDSSVTGTQEVIGG